MAKDYALLEYNQVRRHDRAVDDETWIKALLQQAPIGTLATIYEGQPFINNNIFVFAEAAHAIYMHTAQVGRTRANLEQNERVCFSVQEMGRLLPADTALEFSVEYASVVIFGFGALVTDYAEAGTALQLLLDKYAPHLRPGEHYRPIIFKRRGLSRFSRQRKPLSLFSRRSRANN
jgi:nitroimidazol reductase NimA-like FMN-containing flavoprotein (pyridoxamine 5'-phosphate oxidase superfamily)